MTIYSASKWISGSAMMKEVHSGKINLDDYAHQHLLFWTKDPSDSRSGVTLRHLLGFTSGFSGSTSCGSQKFEDCVKTLYTNVPHRYAPGERFEYNEVHINLAVRILSSMQTNDAATKQIQRPKSTCIESTSTSSRKNC